MTTTLRYILALAIALPFAYAQAGEVVRSLKGLESAVKCETPRADEFEVECSVCVGRSQIADTFMITDGTVFMQMTDGASYPNSPIRAGDRIRASGRVIRQDNDLYNYAKAFKIDILSHGEPPPPAEASIRDVSDGKTLYRPIRVAGTIIDAFRDEIDPRFVFFVLSSGRDIVYASAYCTNAFERTPGLVGATVAVTGSSFKPHGGNNRVNFGIQISTSVPDGIAILKAAPEDPFLAPPLEGGAHEVRKALESASPWRKVEGTVIATWNRATALLKTQQGFVSRISFSYAPAPSVGDVIEVVGLPETDFYTMNLSRAQWRKAEHNASPPESPEDATIRFLLADESGRREFKPGYNGRLVRLVGLVQNIADLGEDGTRITLGDGGFELPIQLPPKFEMDDGLAKGSKIEVVGVCVMETETRNAQTPFPRILGCFVVPRYADDLRVIARPPWWTPARLTLVICALAILILAVLVWNVMLKKVSDRKGRDLAAARFANSVSELKVRERTRLATELHDSIVQSLTGASMKLRAADKMFETNPAASRNQLTLALKTLDSCRDEIRNCIWDLRNQALDEPVMDKVLVRTLTPHVGDTRLTVRFAVPRERLTDNTAHAIICIVRELVLNAVRHGKAKSVQVAGCLDSGKLLFSVKDDGCGFDPASHPGPDDGHFGLQGVLERIEAIGGTMTLISSPGAGTKVSASIAMPKEGKQ